MQERQASLILCMECQRKLPRADFPPKLSQFVRRCLPCVAGLKSQLGEAGYQQQRDCERLHDPKRAAIRAVYRKTAHGKERMAIGTKAWNERNPDKRQCHIILGNALRDGRIQRQPCEKCGEPAEAHHEDYSKPLDVEWLCAKHHKELHKQRRQTTRR